MVLMDKTSKLKRQGRKSGKNKYNPIVAFVFTVSFYIRGEGEYLLMHRVEETENGLIVILTGVADTSIAHWFLLCQMLNSKSV